CMLLFFSSIGQVVNIKAKVNRAFNTSLEVGVTIICEDPLSGTQWKVCKAFATFVAKGSGLQKVQLKPVIPRTSEEQMEYSIAAERRRMRLHHLETIKDLVSSCTIRDGSPFAFSALLTHTQSLWENKKLIAE
ncbi:acyl-coenzyme A thioesterase 11-like, partial [Rhincodon typus]|uniref:acyl-coenzyme A thioesterase 11-like n=1 Tax=Rhincodon typus TaxID=259920 RepID=UPI00202F48EB